MLEFIRSGKQEDIGTWRGKAAFLSHLRDDYNHQNHLYLTSAKALRYQYKNLVIILPHELLPIEECIKKSENILDLPNNWDDEGSESYTFETWRSAVSFVASYALKVFQKERRVIDVPKIYPSMKGSIDIDWETANYGWLVNVEKGGVKASYFADNLQTQKELEGEFLVQDFNFYTSPVSQIF